MDFIRHLYTAQYRLRERLTVLNCLLTQRPPSAETLPGPPREVAFVLVGMLGDTIMCLPVLEVAREIWPGAKLCAIVTPRIREMLKGVEYIDEFVIGTADPMSIRGRDKVVETEERLKSHRFEVAILLGGDQYAPLFYRLGVPVRVGPQECVYRPLFTHAYSIRGAFDWGPDERLNSIRVLGFQVKERVPRLEVEPTARAEINGWLSNKGLPPGAEYVVIHAFGSEPRKWWPPQRVTEVARQLHSETGAYSLLVGGPECADAARDVPTFSGLINAVGELGLTYLLALIGSARLVISTDSGPYHMAGALGRPILGLFAERRPKHAHRYPQGQVVFGDDESCYNRCDYTRCQGVLCRQLDALSTEQVVAAAKRMLQKEAPKRFYQTSD